LGRTLVVNPGPLKNGRLAIIYPDENKADLKILEEILHEI
jgi:Icc-related predicted phosphoesterase